MQTLQQLLDSGITGQIWLAKRGRKYVTIKNNELSLTKNQLNAIAHTDDKVLLSQFEAAAIDDRNARYVPNGFAPINVPA